MCKCYAFISTLCVYVQAVQQKCASLQTILTSLSQALEDPSVGQGQAHASRKSQLFYDNMQSVPATSFSSSSHTSVHTTSHAAIHTTRSAPYLDTSPTEALRDMLRQCGESEEDLHAFAARAMRDDTRETESAPPSLLLSPQKGHELDEFSALYSSTSMTSSSMSSSTYGAGAGNGGRVEVGDVSVSSQRCMNQESVNETWSQMVNAADSNMNGDYIDLIPFMDEEGQNSSLEMECPTTNGSQISISQLSTVASSGYQSFGYSQSSSPVEIGNQGEMTREVTRSPIIHYPMQPLSFSNPLYRHQQLSQQPRRHHHHHHHPHQQTHRAQHYPHQPRVAQKAIRTNEDSSSSLSSGDEAKTVKQSSPVKSDRPKPTSSIDPLRKLSQLSSSSGSNESLNERSYFSAQQDKAASSASGGGGGDTGLAGGVRFTVGPRGGSPAQAQSSPRVERSNSHGPAPEVPPRPDKLLTKASGDGDAGPPPAIPPRPERTTSYCDSPSSQQRQLGMRPYHLSHSMDFGCLQRQHAEQLRRTATDSVIAKTSTPVHMNSGSSSSSRVFSREESFSSVHSSQSQGSLNTRRLSPQSAVHMGISSVQRKLQEQERTKQEVCRWWTMIF